MSIKRSLAVVGAALVATTLALVGTPATAQPIPPSSDDKTVTKCVGYGRDWAAQVKKTVSYTTVDKFTWQVEVAGELPLCDEFIGVGATWRYETPQAKWPQVKVATGEFVTIRKPGKYTVAAPPRTDCGQSDGYVEKGFKPDVPEKLEAPGAKEPHLLNHYFSSGDGTNPWSSDDLKKCKPKPVEPEVVVTTKGCVDNDSKNGEVTVKVTNPNKKQKVTYAIYLPKNPGDDVSDGELKVIELEPGASGEKTFAGRAAGEYHVLVVGSDRSKVIDKVALEECPPPTTTTTVPPETTTTTTVPPETSTSTTTPGIVPVSNEDDLAETGASIALPLSIGALLLLGGGLSIFLVRRRADNN